MNRRHPSGRAAARRFCALALCGMVAALLTSCQGDGAGHSAQNSKQSSSSDPTSTTPTASPSASTAGPGQSCGVAAVSGGDRFRLTAKKGTIDCAVARKVFTTYITKLRRGDAPGNGGGGPVHVRGWTCVSGTAVDPGSSCTKGGKRFTAASAAAASTTANGRTPRLTVTVAPHQHGSKVKLKVHVRGYVYEPISSENKKPIHFDEPAPIGILSSLNITYGDGGTDGGNAGDVGCGKPHVLRKVDDTMTFSSHTYRGAGSYDLKAKAYACGLPRTGVVANHTIRVR